MNHPANYAAWQIDESNFPKQGNRQEQITFLLQYAVLAPSTFNAQPWGVRIINSIIEIVLDRDRMPQKSDHTGRFGFISMGCFIGGIEVAAKHFGWNAKVEYVPDAPIQSSKQLVAKIHLEPIKESAKPDDIDLFPQLVQRATNRSHHQPKQLPKFLEADLQKQMLPAVNIHLYGSEWQSRFMDLSKVADMAIWSDMEFRREHVEWVRSNFTKKIDGMPGFGVGIADVPSLLARPMILSPLFAGLQTKKNQQSLAHSNGFAVTTSDDDTVSWLDVGRSFIKVCLLASKLNLSCAPMGQFIEHSETRTKLQSILNLPKPPQMFMRIGYPVNKVRHSPRRPVSDIIY